MGESLTQQRRVEDEGPRVVNSCRLGRNRVGANTSATLTVPAKEAPANSVPAAAVIQRGQALFGIIGRKGRVGGSCVSSVKSLGLTEDVRKKLQGLSPGEGVEFPV